MAGEEQRGNPSMDADNLYREESITDNQVGSIRRMTPIRKDGSDDTDRSVVYIGQANLMTPSGALPLNFEIEANSLEEAVAKFADGAKAAVDDTMHRLKEMQREAASQIVLPGAEAASKIQIP